MHPRQAGYAASSAHGSYAYDALNRRTEEVDGHGTPVASTTSLSYDAAGNLLAETTGLSATASYAQASTATYGYDALDRQTSAQTAAGGYVLTTYDAAGNVVLQTDQLGYATTSTYDALNRLVSQTDPDNDTTTYAYNAAGQQVSLTDADNNTTTSAYDVLGRLVSQTDPLSHTGTYAYDAAGDLLSTTDRVGRLTTYSYDALGRKTGSTWTVSSTVTNVQTYTYDAAGNQLTAAVFSGAYTMAYDALDRETSVQEPFGQALTYSYDAAGNRTVVQDSQGGTTTSVYNALNQLTTREFGGPGQTPLREDLTYLADGQIGTETRYDNLAGTVLAGMSSYTYDTDDRLVGLTQTYANGSVLASYVYTYDEASRLTSEVDDGGAPITYIYDDANQLLQAGSATYGYDATGNRTNTGYVTGPDNQLLNDGTYSYTYDAAGNLLTKTAGTDVTTYSYDNQNRLVGVIETVGGALQTQATYVYDVFGNRIETEEYTAAGGEVTTEYAYDGANAWANLSGTGTLETRQLFLPGQDQVLARIGASGTAAWYLTDRQGSVRNLLSYDGTTALDTITYDAYGNVTSESNAAQGDAYKYDGYVYDAAIGLYYVEARYYDAGTGRWTQQDPIGFSGNDPDLYRYAGNSPTNVRDPSGLIDLVGTVDYLHKNDQPGYKIDWAVTLDAVRPAGATQIWTVTKLERWTVYREGDGKWKINSAVTYKGDFVNIRVKTTSDTSGSGYYITGKKYQWAIWYQKATKTVGYNPKGETKKEVASVTLPEKEALAILKKIQDSSEYEYQYLYVDKANQGKRPADHVLDG